MPRFFINKEDITGDRATVRGEDSRHIARALRMAVGDTVTMRVADGRIETKVTGTEKEEKTEKQDG